MRPTSTENGFNHASNNNSRVIPGLTATDLDVVHAKEHWVTSKVSPCRLRANPGAGRAFREQESQGFTIEVCCCLWVALVVKSLRDEGEDLRDVAVTEGEEVLCRQGREAWRRYKKTIWRYCGYERLAHHVGLG